MSGRQPEISQQFGGWRTFSVAVLLRRTEQGVVMKAEGEAFMPLADRILAWNDEAQVHVRAGPQ